MLIAECLYKSKTIPNKSGKKTRISFKIEFKSVVGITDVVGQAIVDVVVIAYVVIGMDKEGALGYQRTGK